MPPLILLGLLIALPLLALVWLRVKPLFVFVSIVTGFFWTEFLGEPAELTLRSMVQVSHPEVVIRLVLLLAPLILTLLFLNKSLAAGALPFQFVLLVADSLLLAALLVPLLTLGVQGAIYATHGGSIFRQAHDVIIAGVASVHLIVMYFSGKPAGHRKHRR